MTWSDADSDVVRIKICGVRTESDIDAAIQCGAHAVGLMRVDKSPRHIESETAARLAAWCGNRITPVTVLVDPSPEALVNLPTHWVQLHGHEDMDSAWIKALAANHAIIKAVRADDLDAIGRYDAHPSVLRLLIDAPAGGSGEAFDHQAFAAIAPTLHTPLLIAGGLSAETVRAAIDTLHPWGVDVSSGVESTRGVKDAALIEAFCNAVAR